MRRLKLSPGGLYTILNAELKGRRMVECTCRMPLPFLIERPDPVSANWRIGTPIPCARGCDVLIAEIVTAVWPKYDLLESSPDVQPEQTRTETSEN
jgi:hypothetical protein